MKAAEPPVQAVGSDPAADLEKLGAEITRNEQGEVIQVDLRSPVAGGC